MVCGGCVSERMLKIGRALIKRKLARVAETLMGRSRACIVGTIQSSYKSKYSQV